MSRRTTRSSAVVSKSTFGLEDEDTDDDDESVGAVVEKMEIIEEKNGIFRSHTDDEIDDSYEKLQMRDVEDALESVATQFFTKTKPKTVVRNKKMGKNCGRKNEDDDDKDLCIDVPLVAVRNWLREADDHLPALLKELTINYRNFYSRWLFYLSEGFNILLHGYGSKKDLLNDFCAEMLTDRYAHMIIRGYLPNLRLKDMLLNLAENMKISVDSSNVVSIAGTIRDELNAEHNDVDVVLVVHNMDGPNLRDENTQTAFSLLAEAKNLHIIASVDHVNSAILWNLKKLEKFRWIYFDTPTYRSYVDEISATGNSKILGLNAKNATNLHNLTSLQSVWASLTDNARQIFMLLAKHQLNSTKSNRRQVTFWDLYKTCRDEFIVSSEAALHQQMIEFEDHRLIVKRTAADGSEVLEIAVDDNILNDFIKSQNLLEDD